MTTPSQNNVPEANPYHHDHNPLNADITGGVCSACEWANDNIPVDSPLKATPHRISVSKEEFVALAKEVADSSGLEEQLEELSWRDAMKDGIQLDLPNFYVIPKGHLREFITQKETEARFDELNRMPNMSMPYKSSRWAGLKTQQEKTE